MSALRKQCVASKKSSNIIISSYRKREQRKESSSVEIMSKLSEYSKVMYTKSPFIVFKEFFIILPRVNVTVMTVDRPTGSRFTSLQMLRPIVR